MSSDHAANKKVAPYFQDRELSWLEFNKRVLDQGMDPSVPLFERLNFLSIYWSNLQEFFMIRVGSLADLSLLKVPRIDNKTGLSTTQQLSAIYKRCHELYPEYDRCYKQIRKELSQKGILNKRSKNLDTEQRSYIEAFFDSNIMPFLSPQIVNSRHPFPHLENGALYVVVRLDEEASKGPKKKEATEARKDKGSKNVGAEGVTLGIIPLPGQCKRIIRLPGQGLQYMLLEHVIEMFVAKVFSMYRVKHSNVICVTRNADLDATEGAEEQGEDYREHIKRILKKRTRLMPVRLESERELSATVKDVLLDKLKLSSVQTFDTPVPLNLSYVYDLPSLVDDETRKALSLSPFTPVWPASLDRRKKLIPQIQEKDILVSYPYESMDSFVQLLKEAAYDPNVTSIKITLYRISKQSNIAEALVAAAENGKEVTALFELRARFDESNNIDYSQRLEEAGCHVLYGFRDYKVHSKICCITRRVGDDVEYITQIGTGNYNEKTAKLYTDFSFMTSNKKIGRDAAAFFRNMTLENMSDEYSTLWVAPLQIKQNIIRGIDRQIARKKKGLPCGLFFKTNSITDKDIIDKIVEASQAGVKCTLLVRGISCIVPGIAGYTDNVCVVSIVGRLLEHSRIYLFGAFDDKFDVYLSSADLMTRNMDKRIEVAWPVKSEPIRRLLLGYIGTCMADTAKLRDLLPNKEYTELGYFAKENKANGEVVLFDSQNYLINQAQQGKLLSDEFVASSAMPDEGKVRSYAEDELELTGLMVDSKRINEIEANEKRFEDEYYAPDAKVQRGLADLALGDVTIPEAVIDADDHAKTTSDALPVEALEGQAAVEATEAIAIDEVAGSAEVAQAADEVVMAEPEPVAGPTTEPVAIPATEPAAEPVADSADNPVIEPVADPADNPVNEPAASPAADPANAAGQEDGHEHLSMWERLSKKKRRKLEKAAKAMVAEKVQAADAVQAEAAQVGEGLAQAAEESQAADAAREPADMTQAADAAIADADAAQADAAIAQAADDAKAAADATIEEAQFNINPSGGSVSLSASMLGGSPSDDEPANGSRMFDNGQYIHIDPIETAQDDFSQEQQGAADAQLMPASTLDAGQSAQLTDAVAQHASQSAQYPDATAQYADPYYQGQAATGFSETVQQQASIDANDPRYRALLQKKWQQWIQQNPELYQYFLQQRSIQYQQLMQQQQASAAAQQQYDPAMQQAAGFSQAADASAQMQGFDGFAQQGESSSYDQAPQDGSSPDADQPEKKKSWLMRLLSGE